MGMWQRLRRLLSRSGCRPQGEFGSLPLDMTHARPLGACGWSLDLPLPPHEGDSLDRPRHCLYRLYEDDRELGPRHCPHDRIVETGRGYSVWGATLYFGLPQGSDPRRNGRRYELRRADKSAGGPLRADGLPDQEAVRDALAQARDMGLLPESSIGCPVLQDHCRALPYPYAHALSVGNDADSLTLDMVEAIHQRLERIGLRMGDSFWPCGHAARRPAGTPMLLDGSSCRLGPDAFRLLTMVQRGWIDSLHSWDDDFVSEAPLSRPLEVEAKGEFSVALLALASEASLAVGPHGLYVPVQLDGMFDAVEFVLSDQWGGQHVAVLAGGLGDRPGWEPDAWMRTGRILFCRERNAVRQRLDGASARVVGVACRGAGEGRLRIGPIRPLGLQREVVEEQIDLVAALGALLPVLFCHGGAGFGSALTTDAFDGRIYRDQARVRGGADDPQSPSRHFDLLAARGVRLVWPARPVFNPDAAGTPLSSQAVPVQDLLVDAVARDGTPHYIFPRFLARGDTDHPWHEPDATEHHNENLGFQIARAVSACQRVPGGTAVIYMHWGWTDVLERPEEEPFSLATQKALLALSELAAGTANGGGRFWVCPASVLGVYAAMIKTLPHNVQVAENRVDVSSWSDPRLGDIADFQGFLHGATIYVKKAEKAEVFLDGMPLRWFTRNPPDSSGQESVTIVQDRGRILLGAVSPKEQGMVVKAEGCVVEHVPEARGIRLRLSSSGRATARLEFPHWPAHGYGFLRFACRRSDDVRMGLDLLTTSGVRWGFHEAADRGISSATGVLPGAQAEEGFAYHCHALPPLQTHPGQSATDPVTGISLHAAGPPGGLVELADVALLSAHARLGTRPGVVLGGRVRDGMDRRVLLRLGSEERSTLADDRGVFFFPNVPRGRVAEICLASPEGLVYPKGPRKFEAWEDRWDIRFDAC